MSWIPLFEADKLVHNAGVCARFEQKQIAVFCIREGDSDRLYAIGNWDPIGKASVLSRGIPGSVGESVVVASPLYKQHFCLETGQCLEQEDIKVPVYQVRNHQGIVEILTV